MRAEEERYRAVLALDPGEPTAREALVQTLFDESFRVRRAATDRLAVAPRKAELAARLTAVLRRPGEPGARSAAAEALVKLGPAGLPAVTELLSDPHPDPRKFAVEILAHWEPATVRPLLTATLNDSDPNVRAAAAEALGPLGDAHTARELESRLDGTPTMLHLALLTALERLEHPVALARLVSLTAAAPLQRAAFRLLGFSRDPTAVRHLTEGLLHANPGVQDAALTGLGRLAKRSAAGLDPVADSEPLRALVSRGLAADSSDARRGALILLGALAVPPTVELALEIARAAEDESLAAEAVRALVGLGPTIAPAWGARLAELSLGARQTAGEALGELAAPSLVPVLANLLAAGEADLAVMALRALGRTRSAVAIPILLGALREASHAPLAGRGLETLARSFPAEVLEALHAAFAANPHPVILLTLARVGGPRVLPELRRALRHPDAGIRAAAVQAGAEGLEVASELTRLGLADEAVGVRLAAARGLSRRADVSLVRVALGDAEVPVRGAALMAIGAARVLELLPDLSRHLTDEEPELASAAVRALAVLGHLDESSLARVLAHAHAEVLKDGLDVAPREGWVTPHGIRLLGHARPEVRTAAARALQRVGTPEARAALSSAHAVESDALARDAMAPPERVGWASR